ncbi:hypothetical protein WG947_08415 [Pontibacter sp. H259]|uniref:hypothetical protein n=1 Tax=Pontibacter sp. H259 TaxID=3133421 RepID=UPI0030C0064F
MNYNESDRYNRQQRNYQPNRSEQYRQPGQRNRQYHFDDYGDAAHGGYGNEGYSGTWGNQGNERGGSRNVANRGLSTYDTGRNYGNMGSYGGAQGFGSTRGGFSNQRSSHAGSQFDSGHGRQAYANQDRGYDQPRHYGYQSDYDSHGQNSENYRYNRSNRNIYSDYPTRRYQDTGHTRQGYERDNYSTGGFGRDRGNYMSSGYERNPRRSEYGSTRGDYGSARQYIGRSSGSFSDEPYGMSGYYRGGYNDTDYNSYARDRDERMNDW